MTSVSVSSNIHRAKPCVPIATGASDALSRQLDHVRVSRMEFTGGQLPSHYHEHACLCVVLEGGFTKRFRGRTLDCAAGTLLVQPAGERHSDEFRGSMQLVLEPLSAPGSPFGDLSMFEEIVYTRSALGVASASRITHELRKTDAWSSLAIEGLALELVAHTGRCNEGSAPHGPTAPRWLAHVRERLTSGPKPPTIAELAAMAQVHPVYLGRVFRRHFGMSIGAFARRTRLEWAAAQLSTTAEPLSRISFCAGFADQSHFTREFRRFSGVTPRQYRLAVR
jgi:AraC family transcriptional regulator